MVSVLEKSMNQPTPLNPSGLATIGLLVLILLGSSSLGFALEIHHVFAEVDHDGHQHSDDDLCQWVQSHAANSLVVDKPAWQRGGYLAAFLSIFISLQVSSPVSLQHDSRGPPAFSLI